MRQVYLDYNATTPVHPEVLEVVIENLREDFGNPSSVHRYGRKTRVLVDEARDQVAALIGAPAASIVFCSGGTEANNTILKGWRRPKGIRAVILSHRGSSIRRCWIRVHTWSNKGLTSRMFR